MRFLPVLAVAILAAPVLADPPRGRTHLLVVNVYLYPKASGFALAADPLALARLPDQLRSAFAVGNSADRLNVVVLCSGRAGKGTSKPPTAAAIRAALADLRDTADSDDTVIVYFCGIGFNGRTSGAGADAAVFCPADVDLSRPETLLPLAEIDDRLRRIGAAKTLLVYESCRKRLAVDVPAYRPTSDPADSASRPKGLEKPRSVARFLACSTDQYAYFCKSSGLGVLTCELMNGVGGKADTSKDGKVSIGELAEYLTATVATAAATAYPGVAQEPEITTNVKEAWALVSRPVPEKKDEPRRPSSDTADRRASPGAGDKPADRPAPPHNWSNPRPQPPATPSAPRLTSMYAPQPTPTYARQPAPVYASQPQRPFAPQPGFPVVQAGLNIGSQFTNSPQARQAMGQLSRALGGR